jgi:hypothetical protein
VQCGDRAVVDAEVRVAHHLRHQAGLAALLCASLSQLDVHVQREVVAEEIREDRIDRLATQLVDTEEVMPTEVI